MKYRSKYEYTNEFSKRHVWTVIGRHGAIHLHISEVSMGSDKPDSISGGVEYHYRVPPEYMSDDAPSHDRCSILQGPCWHDGTSSWATDHWIPLWQAAPHEHDRMFELLQGAMEKHITAEWIKVKEATDGF